MSKSEDGDDMNQTKAIRVPKVAKKGERENGTSEIDGNRIKGKNLNQSIICDGPL